MTSDTPTSGDTDQIREEFRQRENQFYRYIDQYQEQIDRLEKTVMLLELENRLLKKDAGVEFPEEEFGKIADVVREVTRTAPSLGDSLENTEKVQEDSQ